MEISSVQHQAMATHLDEAPSCPKSNQQQEKKPRPHPEQAVNCPRCDSTNTKFCYYNNYSLSQPRYFCKGCRRYWTKGGSLRNVPVGGGCRKNKRSSSSSSSSSSSKKSQPDQDLTLPPPLLPALPFPPLSFDSNDLTLAFADDTAFTLENLNPNPGPSPNPTGFLDILRNPSGSFHSMYYGFGGNGGGGGEEVEGAGVSGDGHLMMFPNLDGGFMNNVSNAETVTETKTTAVGAGCGGQSSCQGLMDHGGESNKGLMGMGWPVGGGDHGNSLGLDWNGVGSASSWHGLINSSLM